MKEKKQWYLEFQYNDLGRAPLRLHNDSLIPFECEARTGSVNIHGELNNAIKYGVWLIKDKPVATQEAGMVWDGDWGWKVRLYTPKGEYSHYLIHPDGGKHRGNGTRGCIGLQGGGYELKERLTMILKLQDEIKCFINSPIKGAV